MALNGLRNALWLDTNVTLCCGGTGVLQESLHQGNVVATILVDPQSQVTL